MISYIAPSLEYFFSLSMHINTCTCTSQSLVEFITLLQVNMYRIVVAIASFAATIFALASSQLPCSSQLRVIYPQLFVHCDCHYSEWDEWVVDTASLVTVPTAQCPSGEALSETRIQIAIGHNCADRTETRSICKWK